MTANPAKPAESRQWFDIKSAILGALLMSTLVGLVNAGHGLLPALTAAAKQGAYTFFVAGFIMQFCRWLAQRPMRAGAAVATATLLPTVITVVAVYALHSFRGTPEPVLSTIPVVILCLGAFYLVSRKLVQEAADGAPGAAHKDINCGASS
jgi:ABC-type transport system involved in cytochrome c biogenesis permease subunit